MLSKKKKFYKVYWANGTVNIERRIVIYSNKEYVYYKANDDVQLDCIRTTRIKERPSDGLGNLVTVGHGYTMNYFYCWDVEDGDREDVLSLLMSKKLGKRQLEIRNLECEYVEIIGRSERIKKKIEALKKEGEEVF